MTDAVQVQGGWKVPCKDKEYKHPDCQRTVFYTNESFEALKKYGFTAPEYCEKCQARHSKNRQEMAVSYFKLRLKKGRFIGQLILGPLGKVTHLDRVHVREVAALSTVKDDAFGVTEQNMLATYDWFKDPHHRVLILIGGTGSGKSTKYPSMLIKPPKGIPHDFFTRFGQVIVAQPRQVAAEGTAIFSGDILASRVGAGGLVGWSHGGDRQMDARNLLVQKTHGQVVNMIERGDTRNVGLIMVDEAHDRSTQIDMIMHNLKEQMDLHKHLRVIIASATIDAEKFEGYFGKDITKTIYLEARAHSYVNPKTGEVNWMDEEEKQPYEDLKTLGSVFIPATIDLTKKVVSRIQEGDLEKGDILVFMPGKREVEETVELVNSQIKKNGNGKDKYRIKAVPLYSGVDKQHKVEAVDRKKEIPDTIRIIVSTNIAEAAVTIGTLKYIIETGVSKVPNWDAEAGVTKIPLTLISQSNAKQRWGRAGRVTDGQVFTLYTKDQYEAMPPYPLSDIERLNLESVVTSIRAAGSADPGEGWMDAPPEKEVERAFKALQAVNAIDKDGSLTDYGRLLRRFNYPAKMVDMLLTADMYGCLVEVATLLPMIKNGGMRRLLLWRRKWSAQTKYEVFRIHNALMAGCRDDIEFLLKLFSAWEYDPVTGKKRTPLEKIAWAKRNYVDQELLLKVADERKSEVLSTFYGHKSDSSVRPVDLRLIPRTRVIVLEHMPQDVVPITKNSTGFYQFVSRLESNKNSVTAFCSIEPKVLVPSKKVWTYARFLAQITKDPGEPNIIERLMCDQLLPVNCEIKAKVIGTDGKGWYTLQITDTKGAPVMVSEIFSDAAEEKEGEEEDEETVEGEEKKPEEEAPTVSEAEVKSTANSMKVGKPSFEIRMFMDPSTKLKVGQEVQIVVEKFAYDEKLQAVCYARPVSNTNGMFEGFAANRKVGDKVSLEVVAVGEYPQDPEVSLILRDPATGFILAMDPEDMVFAYTRRALSLIPIGTKVNATLTYIDPDEKFVKASMLPEVEDRMNKLFAEKAGRDTECPVKAFVLEVEDGQSVHMLLEWSIPAEGLLFVASQRLSKWHKLAEETMESEEYTIKIGFGSDWEMRVKLDPIPEEVKKIQGQNVAGRMEIDEEKNLLVYKGRMSFAIYKGLQAVSKDPKYRRVIRRLYWKSNQPSVKRVEGDASKLEPGIEFIGRVARNNNREDLGMFVKLPIAVDGLIRAAKLSPKTYKDFAVDARVRVKVLSVKTQQDGKTNIELEYLGLADEEKEEKAEE